MGLRIIKTHNAQAIRRNRLGPFSRPAFARNELTALDYTESSSTQVLLVFITQTYYAGVPGSSSYVFIKRAPSPSLSSVEAKWTPSPDEVVLFICWFFGNGYYVKISVLSSAGAYILERVIPEIGDILFPICHLLNNPSKNKTKICFRVNWLDCLKPNPQK